MLIGFESFYLYSAVEPAAGYDFTLILPSVNTNYMNVFLAELSKNIKEEIIIPIPIYKRTEVIARSQNLF